LYIEAAVEGKQKISCACECTLSCVFATARFRGQGPLQSLDDSDNVGHASAARLFDEIDGQLGRRRGSRAHTHADSSVEQDLDALKHCAVRIAAVLLNEVVARNVQRSPALRIRIIKIRVVLNQKLRERQSTATTQE
jgi:hypothetical protein